MLSERGVRLGLRATDRTDAIDQVGRILVDIGAVEPEYVAAMQEREASVSTYVDAHVAIPHGTSESRAFVRETALAVAQFPDGVEWGGNDVRLCVGIAARDDQQVAILSALATILMDSERATELCEAPDSETIVRIFRAMDEEVVQ